MNITLTALYSVYILTLALLFYMIYLTVKIGFSKAAMVFQCCDISLLLLILGMFLEVLMGNDIQAALVCLKLQYVGQAIFLTSLLYFFSIFLHVRIPAWIYLLQLAVNVLMLTACMTAEYHTLFYRSARIVTDGLYPMIQVTDGPVWYLHYAHLFLVLLGITGAILVRYRSFGKKQKARCRYILLGINTMTVELILKGLGVFGPFNPFVLAAFVFVICLYEGILRYGYFDTVEAAKENVLNLSTEGLMVINLKEQIMYMNTKMQELFPELQTGMTARRDPTVERIYNGRKEIRRNGVYYYASLEEVSEDGLQGGKMLRLTDMTEYLEELERIRRESESKTDFLTQVSHEIRTPLNTIQGMNEMILTESTEPQILSYAEDIREAEETLLSLIGDILDVTRIEKATLSLEDGELSLAALFRKLWRAAEVRCREKDLALIFTIDPLLPKTCFADEKRCYQIAENLLGNAVKYTEQGRVEFLAKKHGEYWLKLQVRDTGIGIPKEDQEKIFHRFEQLDTGKRRHGLGLGLEITRNLARLMGGRIEVESEVGRGSCFTVFLPVKFTSEQTIGTDWNKPKDACERERIVYRCPGRRILVVDDNEMNRRVVRNYLKNTGIGMDEAGSGKACLEKLAAGASCDLLLLDHMMPGMDGIELLHRIAELDFWKTSPCPAIAMTANAVKGARQMYLAEGFDDYLSKPVDAESLYLMLEEYLGGTLERVRIPGQRKTSETEAGAKAEECDTECAARTRPKEGDTGIPAAERGAVVSAVKYDTETGPAEGAAKIKAAKYGADVIAPAAENTKRIPADVFAKLTSLGMDIPTAKYYADNSEEFLMEELTLFSENSEETLKKMSQCQATGDWNGMAVYVHGLKNNLATLGFLELAQEAKNLELLLRGGQTESGQAAQASRKFLDRYSILFGRLRVLIV